MSASQITLVQKAWSDEPMKPRRERLWLAEGKVCHWCKCPTRMLADAVSWDCATCDHIIPRYKGGSNDESNIVSACMRCNNRRNHEDMCGLPEGALLGKWKIGSTVQSPNNGKAKLHKSALSGDEKKALMSKMDKVAGVRATERELHIQQRDQALKRIGELQEEIKDLKILIQELETMPMIKIAIRRLVRLLVDMDKTKRYI
ncbi:unnamed protein product [Sphagnum jensenii]